MGLCRTPSFFSCAAERMADEQCASPEMAEFVKSRAFVSFIALTIVVNEFLCSANMAFAMYPGLTQGAIAAILQHGSPEQKAAYRASLKAKLEQSGSAFEAKLTHVGGQRIATGNDFDESTGGLKEGSKVRLLSEEDARNLSAAVEAALTPPLL